MLASLGFYGLVTLNVSGRVRVFSIRKVLGANIQNTTDNITRQYIILTDVALIIRAPISFMLNKVQIRLLYPDPMLINLSAVIIAVFVLVFVLFSVVAIQIRKIANSNSVKGL